MCDLWHPVWEAAARKAKVRPAVSLAVQLVLSRDPQLLRLKGAAYILAVRLREREDRIAALLAVLEELGVTQNGRLNAELPNPGEPAIAEAMVNPNTARSRAWRESSTSPKAIAWRQRHGKLSTDEADETRATRATNSALHAVAGNDALLPMPELARVIEQRYQAGLADPADHERALHAALPATPYVYVTKKHKIKEKPALRRQPVSGAGASLEGEELDDQALIKVRWVTKVMRFGATETKAGRYPQERYDWLCDGLTTKLLTAYAMRRCNLPREFYDEIQKLDLRMKGRAAVPAQPAPDPQASLLLPIEEPVKIGLGAPGTDTLAPIEGELPEALSA